MATEQTAIPLRQTATGGRRRHVPGSRVVVSRRGPFRRLPFGGLIGLAIVVLLLAVALVGPVLVPANAEHQNLVGRLAPPLGFGGKLDHPLGTDPLGRDILARLVAGARVSLTIGVMATLAAGTAGVALGLVAGYVGGAIDRLIGW